MIETAQAFIRSINERKHVLLLIENTELKVDFINKDETISLSFKNGEVLIAYQEVNSLNKCSIRGEKDKIKDLISGREKLRTLMIKGDLQCAAPFRTILLLESFFCLCKTETYFERIS